MLNHIHDFFKCFAMPAFYAYYWMFKNKYIETFYNTVRIHGHCGYLSPVQYEEQYHNKLKEMDEKLAG